MLSDTYYFLLLNPICWYFQSVSPSLPSSLWSILLIRLQTNYLALFALISNNMGRWEKKLEIKGRRDVVHAIQSREMSHHVFVVVSQLTPPPHVNLSSCRDEMTPRQERPVCPCQHPQASKSLWHTTQTKWHHWGKAFSICIMPGGNTRP